MEDVSSNKRPKKPNFTPIENCVLLQEVREQKNILMSSSQSSVTIKKKAAVWSKITEEVNAVGGSQRTVEQVKRRWKDLKCAVLNKGIKGKHTPVTGGGPPSEEIPYEEAILTILESKSSGIEDTPKESYPWTSHNNDDTPEETYTWATQNNEESGAKHSDVGNTSLSTANNYAHANNDALPSVTTFLSPSLGQYTAQPGTSKKLKNKKGSAVSKRNGVLLTKYLLSEMEKNKSILELNASIIAKNQSVVELNKVKQEVQNLKQLKLKREIQKML